MRRPLPATLLVVTLATGCSDGASAPQVEAPSSAPATPAHSSAATPAAAGPAPATTAPPWSDPIALAAGISSTHYVPAITSGEPYSVSDPVTGTRYELGGPDLIEDEGGRPQAFATGPARGHALAAVEATNGVRLVLDYALTWDAKAATMSGKPGAFKVTGVDIHQLGDDPPRHQFVQEGEVWVRKPAK